MSPHTKKTFDRARSHFFREKYRFDQGNSFLVFVNFSLLVISLTRQSGNSDFSIPLIVAVGILTTWLLGYVLDRVVKVQEAQEKVSLSRSHIWKQNFERHDELEEKIDRILKKLDKLDQIT